MKFIIGTKEYMTQLFDEAGRVLPVTVLSVPQVVVTKVKTTEADKYNAIQVGYGEKKAKNAKKPVVGQYKELVAEGKSFAGLKEFRVKGSMPEMKTGDEIKASTFAVGDVVEVSSISKGKGFQGVVKRHGFSGGPRSHGQKHSEREPGSIGATGPQRVFKGLRMAGRMGADRVTVKNLKVAAVDADNNLIFIKGAIPGRKGTLVEVKTA